MERVKVRLIEQIHINPHFSGDHLLQYTSFCYDCVTCTSSLAHVCIIHYPSSSFVGHPTSMHISLEILENFDPPEIFLHALFDRPQGASKTTSPEWRASRGAGAGMPGRWPWKPASAELGGGASTARVVRRLRAGGGGPRAAPSAARGGCEVPRRPAARRLLQRRASSPGFCRAAPVWKKDEDPCTGLL